MKTQTNQDKRRTYETSAIEWLGIANRCNGYKTGERELALALASAHMEAADACILEVKSWTPIVHNSCQS